MLTLKNILLSKEGKYDYDDFNDDFDKLTYDYNITDEDLLKFLLYFLEYIIRDGENNFSEYRNQMVDHIYKYLGEIVTSDSKYDTKAVVATLKTIDSILSTHTAKNEEKNDPLYNKFWCSAEYINSIFTDYIKGKGKYDINNNPNLLEVIVYDIKNLFLIQELHSKMPHLFLKKGDCGKILFDKLIVDYINIILDDNANINDIIYFDMVISLFVENKRVNAQSNVMNSLLLAIDTLKKNKKLDKKGSKQKLLFLNQLRKKLLNEKEYINDENELNQKYRCYTSLAREGIKTVASYLENQVDVYHDFTDKKVITIDSSETKILDDGISIEKLNNGNSLLGIYITDVSKYVTINSGDDIEAFQKGQILYGSDNLVIPMLRNEITYGCCSLLPGNKRHAVICFFELDNNGNIIDHSFTKGIIRTREEYHFSYEKVNKILNNGHENADVYDILHNLQILTETAEFNKLVPTNAKSKINSNMIINKFMVLVNYMSALDTKQAGLPFIFKAFRNADPQHIISDNKSLSLLINDLYKQDNKNVINSIIGNSFSRPYYTTDPQYSGESNLEVYASISNPLRCYADLVNQRLVKLFLVEKNYSDKLVYELETVLTQIADILNTNNLISSQYLNDYAHILKKN
jgi:hypothetical protein